MLTLLILIMVMFTIYTSVLADVKVGLITSIWSIGPFLASLTDYLVFGLKLKTNEYIGIVLIVFSICVLSFKPIPKVLVL